MVPSARPGFVSVKKQKKAQDTPSFPRWSPKKVSEDLLLGPGVIHPVGAHSVPDIDLFLHDSLYRPEI